MLAVVVLSPMEGTAFHSLRQTAQKQLFATKRHPPAFVEKLEKYTSQNDPTVNCWVVIRVEKNGGGPRKRRGAISPPTFDATESQLDSTQKLQIYRMKCEVNKDSDWEECLDAAKGVCEHLGTPSVALVFEVKDQDRDEADSKLNKVVQEKQQKEAGRSRSNGRLCISDVQLLIYVYCQDKGKDRGPLDMYAGANACTACCAEAD